MTLFFCLFCFDRDERREQYVLFSAEVRAIHIHRLIALNPLQIINSCSMFLLSR
jgi:hypothetical protein